jgi:hypothetical protein
MPREEDLSRFDNSSTFTCPDRVAEVGRAKKTPCFYLYESEEVATKRDKIDLASPRPEIPRDNGPAFAR